MNIDIKAGIEKFKSSEITHNIATLSAGSVISQIIPVVMSLILSRLYTPKDYGDFSIFINCAGIIAVFISLRYEYAIVRPKRNVDAFNLITLCGIIAISISIILTLLFILSDWMDLDTINSLPGKNWLPIYIICIATLQIFSNYANRVENYKVLAISSITRSLAQAFSRIIFGILHYGTGLITGSIIGLLGGCLTFTRKIHLLRSLRRCFSWKRIKELMQIYNNFPKYLLPSGLLNTLSTNLPVILLADFYAKDSIGHFSMAISILYLPISLIGNALGQVFYKKASSWQPRQTNALAIQFLTLNSVIGLITFGILLSGGERLFMFLLGKDWSIVGLYAIYLCPWLISVLCISPLGWIFDARDQQRTEMYLNIGMFVSRTFVILLGGYLQLSFDITLLLYSITGLFLWLIEGVFIYRVLEIKASNTQKILILTYICFILICWLIRIW
ncbi:MAG: oligosaccharide flippase family protein [Parabacteroides sp.]|nr:oligosaccharide flippase family protein [Parabacteroides sp.]